MWNGIGTPEVVKILRRVLADIRDEARRENATTGRRWRRPGRRCPDWCATDHTCTARHGYPSGQHRSPPTTWDFDWGRLVATRVAGLSHRPRLELRVVVHLDGVDDRHALEQGVYVPMITADAIGAILAELAIRHTPQPLAGPAALPHIPRRVVDGATVPPGGTCP
jgi:hypothetical protein